MSACSRGVSPCCTRSDAEAAAASGAPAPKKACCVKVSPCCQKRPNGSVTSSRCSPCCSKPSGSSKPSGCSPCCSKTKLNSNSKLSPNHYQLVSKGGMSSCCSEPEEPVEFLHFSGDRLDDIFPNHISEVSSARQGIGAKLRPNSTSLPKSQSHDRESRFPASSLKRSSSPTIRKGPVWFSEGASPEPSKSLTSSPKSASSGQGQSRREIFCSSSNPSPNRSLKMASQPTNRGCRKICCKSPPSSHSPRHFHLYRPVPSEDMPTASRWCTSDHDKITTMSRLPGVGPRVSPRDGQPTSRPPSRSVSPFNFSLLGETPPIRIQSVDAWTSTDFPAQTLAPDPEQRKSVMKVDPSQCAEASTTVPDPTPDPDKRKSILPLSSSKSADASTSTIAFPEPTPTPAPDVHQSPTIQICSPLLLLNTSGSAVSKSSTSTSSSRGNSPSRPTSSCFFFGRSPKRSRPNQQPTLPTTPQKSKSLSTFTPEAKALSNSTPPVKSLPNVTPPGDVSNGSTSIATSSKSPRSCPNHAPTAPRLQGEPTLSPVEPPTMPPPYRRLPSRPEIDCISSPYYHQSASLSYSRAQKRSRTGPQGIPDVAAASSPSDLTTGAQQQSESPSRPACEPPSRPASTSWFSKPCWVETVRTPKPEAQQSVPGRARRFWARLWNKSDLASLLTPILSPSKGPGNPQYVKDERWIEWNDTRAFCIFGVNVVIVIVLSYFVDLLHDGKQNAEAVRAADHGQNSKCSLPCPNEHPPTQYRGSPVHTVDIIK